MDDPFEMFDVEGYIIMVNDAKDGFQEGVGIRMKINSSNTADYEVAQIRIIIIFMEGGKG